MGEFEIGKRPTFAFSGVENCLITPTVHCSPESQEPVPISSKFQTSRVMSNDRKGKRLILHIGTEKTGTTSIQNVLAGNRERLRENGIVFPRSLGPINHTLLAAVCLDDGIRDNIKAHHLAREKCTEDELRNRLSRALEEELCGDGSWDTLIVSTELIHSRLTQPSEIDRLWGLLSPHVDEVRVVVFLRRQDEQALSRYSSVLRAGHSGFDDVFEDLGGHFYLRTSPERNINDFDQYYDYQRLIERFEKYVSQDDIFVRIYHDYQGGDGVVREFLEVSGLNAIGLEKCRTNLNRPISVQGQFIMCATNRIAKPWRSNGLRNEAYKELQKVIEKNCTGERRQVARSDAERFVNRFSNSNEWVRARFFPEREALFSADFSNYPETVDYANFREALSEEVDYYTKAARRLPLSRLKHSAARIGITLLKRVRNGGRALCVRLRCEVQHALRSYLRFSPIESHEQKPEYQFALARILGSDHYPRHSSKQTLTNLLFTLENEPDFPGCKKFFVVNRIFDKEAESAILSLLDSRGVPYVHIPFDGSEYAATDWDTEPFGGDAYFSSTSFKEMNANMRERDRCFAAAPKVRYAMNVNGARNAAIKEGARYAEWILALDGNCIFTENGFERLRESVESYPYVPYIVLPMRRLVENNEYFDTADGCASQEEPQIAIHRTAREAYDEWFPYGFRDKAELFTRIGIPGPWQHWSRPFWCPKVRRRSPDRGLYKYTDATVLRLSSGMNSLDKKRSSKARYSARSTAILKSLHYLDRLHSNTNLDAERIIYNRMTSSDSTESS